MIYRELAPSSKFNDKPVKCNSCKNKHLYGDRLVIRTTIGYKDYCPKCTKARTYIELEK